MQLKNINEVETFRKIRGIKNKQILTSIPPVEGAEKRVHKINHNALFL